MTLSINAKNTIKELLENEYSEKDIIDAMCDGEYLLKEGISQDEAEEITSYLKYEKTYMIVDEDDTIYAHDIQGIVKAQHILQDIISESIEDHKFLII